MTCMYFLYKKHLDLRRSQLIERQQPGRQLLTCQTAAECK